MPHASPESISDQGEFQKIAFSLELLSSLSVDGSCSFELGFFVSNAPASRKLSLELDCRRDQARFRVECDLESGLLAVSTFHENCTAQRHEVGIDFSALSHWRFYLILFPDGCVEVRFFDLPLIEAKTELQTAGILQGRSNFSFKPTLVPELGGQPLRAVYDAQTENLIAWSNDPALTLDAFKTAEANSAVFAGPFREQLLGRWPIWVYSHHRSKSEVSWERFNNRDILVFELKSYPSIELSVGHFAVRTHSHDTRETLIWSIDECVEVASSRVALTKKSSDIGSEDSYKYFFTPMSEILRCLNSTSPAEQVVSLRTYVGGPVFRVKISIEILRAMATILSDLPLSPFATKIELQCLVVDLWAWARDEAVFNWIGRTVPVFQTALVAHRDLVGEKTPLPDLGGGRRDMSQPAFTPSPHDIMIWSSQRDFAEAIAAIKSSRTPLNAVMRNITERMDPKVRDWTILTLSEMALRNGVGHELARAVSDEFVWSLLNQPERTWEYSSLTALLAALGEFGTIVAILETLSNLANPTSLQSVNFAAISASFEALCLSRPPLELREVFLRSFLKLVDRLDSLEFTRFRSLAIQSALIGYAKLARFDPFWLQDEFLAFIETQYATVPEFWASLRSSLASEPSNDFIARLYSIGEAADLLKLHFDNLQFLADGGSDCFVQSPAIIAAPRRQRYFETLNAIHRPDGRSNAKELLREDTFIVRLLALPPAFVPRKLASYVQPQRVRDCVQRLQKYPRSRYHRLLDELGNAALRLDFTNILRALDDFELIDFRDDAPSEAVVVDILCWAVLTSEPSAHNTARLVEILERWVMALSPNVASHVDLPSILGRVLTRGPILSFISMEKTREVLNHEGNPGLKSNRPATALTGSQSDITQSYFGDTIVAVVTCQANLGTHARTCLDTWVADVGAFGIRVIFFCGQVAGSSEPIVAFDGELVVLPVGDYYEDLPEKMLAIFDWVHAKTDCAFVVKIDDDCFLDAENFFGSMSYRRGHYFGRPLVAFPHSFDRAWHQEKSKRDVNRRVLDCSPLGSTYADGGGCYSLSRTALTALVSVAASRNGMQLRLASLFEDKLIGDLLAEVGFTLNSEGYTSAQRRSTQPGGYPVLQIDRTFLPSKFSGINMAHLNGSEEMRQIRDSRGSATLSPARLFGLDREVSLGFDSTMLEVIGDSLDVFRLREATYVCVACVHNEAKLLPHFLAHHRRMGFDYFLIIDNLSDDGSREYLIAQGDVAVFSATSEYSKSHFGVDWQKCILDHFCIGKWVLIADVDEFLVTEGVVPITMKDQCERLESNGFDAAIVAMVDMYPRGALNDADFAVGEPLSIASCFDSTPVRPWPFNRGPFDNLESLVSSFRHRILPMSAPHTFTSQKVALFRYSPLMSFSEGFHFGSGMRWSPVPLAFLHFKYSSDFVMKVHREVARGQHFGNAAEYRLYLQLEHDGQLVFWRDRVSKDLKDCRGSPLGFLLGKLCV